MSWVLGVVGVVILSVLVDIVLPEGQMNKYIKGIFAILLIYMLLSPVVALVNKDIDINNLLQFNSFGYEENSAYIQSINTDRLEISRDAIKSALKSEGYNLINIVIFSAENNINLVDYTVVEINGTLTEEDEERIKAIVKIYLIVTEDNIRIISYS